MDKNKQINMLVFYWIHKQNAALPDRLESLQRAREQIKFKTTF